MLDAPRFASQVLCSSARRVLCLATALALAVQIFQPLAVASAFPRPTNNTSGNCNDEDVTYAFSAGSWQASEMDAVRDGFEDWQSVRDWDGSLIVTTMLESGLNEFSVNRVSAPGGDPDLAGYASCLSSYIDLRLDLTDFQFWHWARHEMGHILGNEHTGTTDSFGGQPETMATCTEELGLSLSQDDWGAITHKLGGLSPRSIHPNASFEDGLIWWGTSGVSEFYTDTTYPWDGPRNLRFRPSQSGGFVYQTMNYAAAGGTYVDARVNYRKLVTTATTGTLTLKILVRSVSYEPDQCDDQFDTGVDQNTRDFEGGWITVRTESFTPLNSWQIGTEATTYQITSSYDAVDIRIQVVSSVAYTSGGWALIALDTTRVRDRS